jgi:hypothetical protein
MKPFKLLKIPEHNIISDKLYEYTVNNTSVLESKSAWNTLDYKQVLDFIPELKSVALNFNLEINMISIIKLSATAILHIDYSRDVRFLWPVKNCQGSSTKFYKLNGSRLRVLQDHNGTAFIDISNPEMCILTDELELLEPVVFNSAVPHKVFIDEQNTGIRLSATIGFLNPPLHMLD